MRTVRSIDLEWINGNGYQKKILLADEAMPPRTFLQMMRFKAGERVPPHYHRSQTEVFLFLDKGVITIEGEEHEMENGDLLVCEPGEIHEVPAQEEFHIIVLKMDYEDDDTVWIDPSTVDSTAR